MYLSAGKHVLVEKPLTMPDENGSELVEMADKRQRTFAVVHNFQFARSMLQAKKKIQTGELGEITGVEAIQWSNPHRRLPTWYEELPSGLFWDESPHLLYLIKSIFGNSIDFIDAQIMPAPGRETPALVTALFQHGDTPIRISQNFHTTISAWYLCIAGTQKMALVDLYRDILITVPNDRQHQARDVLRNSESLIGGHLRGIISSGALFAAKKLYYGNDVLYKKFIEASEQGHAPQGFSGLDGVKIVEMQKQILACRTARQ
jgi:scyllo-inositol 2-dehydrogenase (NADP+)